MSTVINTHRRFEVLRRFDFTCAFCGAKPGNERLQVDHLVSQSLGGSDHDNNLAATCDRCNNGKSARVVIPIAWCEDGRDFDGWITWRRWGEWELKWNSDPSEDALEVLVISTGSGMREYESDWEEHIREKAWVTTKDYLDSSDVELERRKVSK